MILAAPLVIPFAEAVGISVASIGMAKAADMVNDYIQENPEQSVKILSAIVPNVGIGQIFANKEDSGDDEEVEVEVEEDTRSKKEIVLGELGKEKGNYSDEDAEGKYSSKRGRIIRALEDAGKVNPDREYNPEKKYQGYKRFLKKADGGAIGIEVLFGPKRQELFMGGPALTGPALNIYNSMKAYQSFTDQEIADAIKEAGYSLSTADSGTTTPPDSTPGSSQPSGDGDGNRNIGSGGFGLQTPAQNVAEFQAYQDKKNSEAAGIDTAMAAQSIGKAQLNEKIVDQMRSQNPNLNKYTNAEIISMNPGMFNVGEVEDLNTFQKMKGSFNQGITNVMNSPFGQLAGFALNPAVAAAKGIASLLPKSEPVGMVNGKAIYGVGSFDTVQGNVNAANQAALNQAGMFTNFQLGNNNDPGRVAGDPTKNVFAGMNAQSAFGDITAGAQSRVDTISKNLDDGLYKDPAAKKKQLEVFQKQLEIQKQNVKKQKEIASKKAIEKLAAKEKAKGTAAKAKKLNPTVYANLDKQTGNTGGSFADQQAANKAANDHSQGQTGMGSCFIAGTKVTMADDTLKNIEDVKVGDKVKGHKEENTVIKLDPTLLGDRKLYSFNDNKHYFFTSEHPFMTEEGWKSIKPEKTKERDGVELYDQLKGELKVGDKLVTDNGPVEVKDIKSKEMNNPEMPLYNFNVSNDNSYIADDYVVHNKGCFLKGTLITMADGTTKPVEQVDLGDEVAVGGKVFAVGRFLNTELYDYKGIKVSGSHMVNEDGTWMRVRDTKNGKSLGDDQNTVYVFGSENRRILINGILFTDYFEVNEQDILMEDSEDFFNNSKNYGKIIDEQNVDILNAS